MVQLSCSDAELVAACLAQAGVCHRCCTRYCAVNCHGLQTELEFCIRFQGQRASSAYLVQEREEREKQIRPNPCTVCLGTLQVRKVLTELTVVVMCHCLARDEDACGSTYSDYRYSFLALMVCLCVLQDCVMVPLLDSVVETITNSGYDSHTFSLSLSLPLCQALRQRSALVHLRERLPGSALAGLDIVPIKQVAAVIKPVL